MTDTLTIFAYPDETVAQFCEQAANLIRAENRKLMDSIVKVGECLIRVKAMLGHGTFCDWLNFHFHMSVSTADNYMNAARAVEQFPNLWEYDPGVVYLFTHSLPPAAADAILAAGPLPIEEARCLIRDCKGQEWYDEIAEMMDSDPGAALHRITWAMGDSALREHAARALHEYADVFAELSDREPWEVQKEAGMTLPERLRVIPVKGSPACLYLYEGEANHRIALWGSNQEPEDLVILPKPKTPEGRSWQNALLDILLQSEKVKVKTADDLF